MLTLQTLRRSRGLTLVELALLTGVPARTLGAIECGVHPFEPAVRRQLATAFGIAPTLLSPVLPPPLAQYSRQSIVNTWAPPLAAAILAGMLAFAPGGEQRGAAMQLLLREGTRPAWSLLQPARQSSLPGDAEQPATVFPVIDTAAQLRAVSYVQGLAQSERSAVERTPVRQGSVIGKRQNLPGLMRTSSGAQHERVAVMVNPDPEQLEQSGVVNIAGRALTPSISALAVVGRKQSPIPRGCPLRPAGGRVVITQGYGVGTHAPADRWGAVDLALDTSGDGYAEPEESAGIPVVATHSGRAQIYPNSWPGGNFVRIEDSVNGWVTAYGHLAQINVNDGEWITAGTQIGSVGSTGYSTGPHLHYEVWHNGVNIDPTSMVGCE